MRHRHSLRPSLAVSAAVLATTLAPVASNASTPFDPATLQAQGLSLRLLQHYSDPVVLTAANGINLAGEVVGRTSPYSNGAAVRWDSQGLINAVPGLAGYTATNMSLAAIRPDGTMLGQVVNLGGYDPAVVWPRGGSAVALPAPVAASPFSSGPNGVAGTMNASGLIIGSAAYSGPLFSNIQLPTLWTPNGDGTYTGARIDTHLTPSGSPYSGSVSDLSDSGYISGSVAAGPGLAHGSAAVWNPALQIQYLPDPTLPNTLLSTYATNVAEDGTAVGNASFYVSGTSGTTAQRAVRWTPASTGSYSAQVLPDPASLTLAYSLARGMTPDGGVVVGTGSLSTASTAPTVGLLWTADGTPFTLSQLLQDPSWTVTEADSVIADDHTLLISAMARPTATPFADPVPVVLTAALPEPSLLAATVLLAPALHRRRR